MSFCSGVLTAFMKEEARLVSEELGYMCLRSRDCVWTLLVRVFTGCSVWFAFVVMRTYDKPDICACGIVHVW